MNINAYSNLINPKEIQSALDLLSKLDKKLDICLEKKQVFYGKRSELIKKIKIYQNEVEDDELDAMFNIEGKTGITPEGKEVSLVNAEQRKAFIKLFSKKSRKRLVELDSELSCIKLDLEEAESEYSHILHKINNTKYFLEAIGNALHLVGSNGKISHVVDIKAKTDLNMTELRNIVSELSTNTTGVLGIAKEVNMGVRKYSKEIVNSLSEYKNLTIENNRPKRLIPKKSGKKW